MTTKVTGQPVPRGSRSTRDLLDSAEFKGLVKWRWTFSLILLAGLFVLYYGYILLIAYDKPLLAKKIGEVTTLGIPLGVGVIVLAWVLTAIYVSWANRSYDAHVRHLKDQLK